MTLHDISRLSIYRHLNDRPKTQKGKKQKEEALSVYPFFIRLQDFVEVHDVTYGEPDPPDFVLFTIGKKVGVELTTLNRRVFLAGGDRRQEAFRQWENTPKESSQPTHIFPWEEYTLRDVFETLRKQLAKKARETAAADKRFDENWLVFQIGDGGPCGAFIEANFHPAEKLKKVVRDYASKFLYETALICGEPHHFGQIIFTSGAYFVSFPAPSSGFRLRVANPALVGHGATISNAVLDRIHHGSSVRRRYHPSQGPLDEWLNMPLDQVFDA
jgi:hypothetical protein